MINPRIGLYDLPRLTAAGGAGAVGAGAIGRGSETAGVQQDDIISRMLGMFDAPRQSATNLIDAFGKSDSTRLAQPLMALAGGAAGSLAGPAGIPLGLLLGSNLGGGMSPRARSSDEVASDLLGREANPLESAAVGTATDPMALLGGLGGILAKSGGVGRMLGRSAGGGLEEALAALRGQAVDDAFSATSVARNLPSERAILQGDLGKISFGNEPGESFIDFATSQPAKLRQAELASSATPMDDMILQKLASLDRSSPEGKQMEQAILKFFGRNSIPDPQNLVPSAEAMALKPEEYSAVRSMKGKMNPGRSKNPMVPPGLEQLGAQYPGIEALFGGQ